jgi:hypothetical protein
MNKFHTLVDPTSKRRDLLKKVKNTFLFCFWSQKGIEKLKKHNLLKIIRIARIVIFLITVYLRSLHLRASS